jgi:hypothetical protein
MSSWTVMISGACTRHAYKPLFENLPAWAGEDRKFRVFPRLFDQNHQISGVFRGIAPTADALSLDVGFFGMLLLLLRVMG